MKKIPFVKYTACGNNFVIIDELGGPLFSEREWPAVASHVTSPFFGIGCDNLLVLQPATGEKLREIADAKGYWSVPPETGEADLLFRMFEPDGSEAFSCGNGLMSIAEYLRAQRSMVEARVVTELPLATPRVIRIGSVPHLARSFVTLGEPRRMPESLVDRSRLVLDDTGLERIDDLVVELRSHDLSPLSEGEELVLQAYLAFTGEPHLVVFPEVPGSVEPADVAGTFFSASVPNVTDTTGAGRRVNFGTSVLRRIGHQLNRRFPRLFPAGINVNVARVDAEERVIEYRCFERGINRETLACGTGALAVTHAVSSLGMLDGEQFTVHPHRCRWHEPDTVIGVTRHARSGWTLDAAPQLVCEGAFIASADPLASHHNPDVGSAVEEARGADLGESAPVGHEAAA